MKFCGILCYIDAPSDTAPSGARGHKVLLRNDAVKKALHTLIEKPISYESSYSSHKAVNEIGTITEAYIVDNCIQIRGELFAEADSKIIEDIKNNKMGLSYDVVNALVDDLREYVWSISDLTFTGAVILYADKAAYKNSSIVLE